MSPEQEPEFDRELFTAKWELQLNQCRLNDVRDAQKAITLEWDRLQEERFNILSRIVQLEEIRDV